MRILVIILSAFAVLLMVEHVAVPVRLTLMTSWGVRTAEMLACVGLFGTWALATALVYRFPGAAVWSFAVAGVIGLFGGVLIAFPALVLWGTLANGFALLTTLARREQSAAEQIAWRRTQQDLAVYLALRGLQETVPELLAPVPDGELNDGERRVQE